MKKIEFFKSANSFITTLSMISFLLAFLMIAGGIAYPIIGLIFGIEVSFDCAFEYLCVFAVLLFFGISCMQDIKFK